MALKDYIPSFVTRTIRYLKGLVKSFGKYYVFEVLTPKSINSESGYVLKRNYLPGVANLLVVTGEKYISQAASLGEGVNDHDSNYDSSARAPFDEFTDVLQVKTIANYVGEKGKIEHKAIKSHMTPQKSIPIIIDTYKKLIKNWDSSLSINEQITNTSVNVINKLWFDLPEISVESSNLISQAEKYLVERDFLSEKDFSDFLAKLKKLNDDAFEELGENINTNDNYLKHVWENTDHRKPSDTNAFFGLVVEGNITTLIVSALVFFSNHPELLAPLKSELENLDGELTPDFYNQKIRALEYLHLLYLESLRYFSPGLPVVRYASKATNLNGIDIPANTYVFVPLRSILNNPNVWKNPEEFDPKRHINPPYPLHRPPFTPFSAGKRMCPAANGTAEAMFKLIIFLVFKDYLLSLKDEKLLEKMPVYTALPRLKEKYYAELGPKEKNEINPSSSSPVIFSEQDYITKEIKLAQGVANSLLEDDSAPQPKKTKNAM